MAELLPDPDLVEHLRGQLIDGNAPPGLRKYGAQTFGFGSMHGWTEVAAQQHAEECTLAECKTCTNFVWALSLFAAYSIEFPEMIRHYLDS